VSYGDLGTLAAVVLITGEIVLRIAALGIIPRNRKPTAGMAWLLVILFDPWIGFFFFLFFGSARVGGKRRAKQAEINLLITERTASVADPAVEASPLVSTFLHLNRKLGALPPATAATVELFPDYLASMAAMTEAIATAQTRVHVEFYISDLDDTTREFFRALADAAGRGVKVRFLFDHLGSRKLPGHKAMLEHLTSNGIEWYRMMPVRPLHGQWRRPDLRNHRKILVVDDQIAFCGSQNLVEASYGNEKYQKMGRKWVDLMARVTGTTVAALDAVFAGDWYTESGEMIDVKRAEPRGPVAPDAITDVTCQVVPSGPGFPSENNLRLFTSLLASASRRISITSPYFVPDESLLYAITTAAQRGVDVELFVNEQSDQFMVGHAQASYYDALLAAGVKILMYPPPLILHGKHFSIDDTVAVIGTSNMDLRSFALNYEVCMMLLGPEAVAQLRQVEDAYRSLCRPLTQEEWARRPQRTRYVDTVMRLTAALQ
jgi:cardiolipin synthase A/B